jgi:hypothetical protein
MPSATRFASLRDTVRNHPVVVASSAASVGVLLGAFVAVQLLATPQPRADSAAAPQMALTSKGEAKPIPETKPVSETTGSAPTNDRTASVDCERETWPYLSRPCMEEMQGKHRTRVISTDKLDRSTISAIEASPPAPPAPESKPGAPAVANTAPVSPSSVDLAAAPSAVFAAPGPLPAALTSAAPPPQPAANAEAKKEKRVATKSKRKPRAEPAAPAKQESDDDETSVASNGSDDRASDERSERRTDRRIDRRRIVERWTERDYDVPASNGDGQRRVTVIRRGGGGLFESLFGN